MSRLSKLLARLCPNGVEYKRLGEMFDMISGMSGVSNKWAENGNCRFIDYMNVYKNQRVDVNDLPYATVKSIKQTELQKGDVLFTSASEVPDECAVAGEIEDDIVSGIFLDDHLFGLRAKKGCSNLFCSGFLKYVFQSPNFRNDVRKVVRGVTRFYIAKNDFLRLSIPLPPLEIQREVVEILDKFAQLTAELTAELAKRKKQYSYYRDMLLNFEGADIEWKKLGEIAEIMRGGNLQKKDFTETGCPCIHYGQIYTRFGMFADKSLTYISNDVAAKQKFAQAGDIVMAVTSENVEDVCKCVVWMGDKPAAVSGHTAIIRHNQNTKYLAYFFHTRAFGEQKRRLAHGTKVIEVTPSRLMDIEIPLPPLAEQKRIVAILDRFDALCNSLSEGLPAEIELRRKQYEYYRDKLLSFKEAS